MTNYGQPAILAELRTHDARLRTARVYALLIALETFPPGADGWREVSAELLCGLAGLNRKSFDQARRELIDAKLIEYRPGTHRGERSRWRITFPVDEPTGSKVTTQSGHLPGSKVTTQSGHLPKVTTQSGHSTTVEGGHPTTIEGADTNPPPWWPEKDR